MGAVGKVGTHIGNKLSFDARNYGYSTLSKLLAATRLLIFVMKVRHVLLFETNELRRLVPCQLGLPKFILLNRGLVCAKNTNGIEYGRSTICGAWLCNGRGGAEPRMRGTSAAQRCSKQRLLL